ncbi:MAG: hypothetical protein AAGJ34_07130 [Pseudomonadota bacterium]
MFLRSVFLATGLVGIVAMPSIANDLFGHVGLSYSLEKNSGNGVNVSGFPNGEPEDYNNTGISGEVGTIFDTGVTLVGAVEYEWTDVPSSIDGADVDEGLDTYGSLIFTFGHSGENSFFGFHAGRGELRFDEADDDQNTVQNFWGMGYGYDFGAMAVGASLSQLNIVRGDNLELLDDATFVNFAGLFRPADSNWSFGGNAYFGSGTQDANDFPNDNPMDVVGLGVEVSFDGGQVGSLGRMRYTVGYDIVEVNEESTSGSTETVTHDRLFVGISLNFGHAGKPDAIAVAELPNLIWAQSGVAIVD